MILSAVALSIFGSISTGVYKSLWEQLISHKYTLYSSEVMKLLEFSLFTERELISLELFDKNNFFFVFFISGFDDINFGIKLSLSFYHI